MCLGGDSESCAQENKAWFAQICIWNKYQPCKLSGSAVHSAALTVYQSQRSAPFPADDLRSCAPTATPARAVDGMEARTCEEPTIKLEDNKQTSLFCQGN